MSQEILIQILERFVAWVFVFLFYMDFRARIISIEKLLGQIVDPKKG